MRLKGTHIYLRALEPEDLEFLFEVENNTSLWEVSNTLQPYSKYILKNYLENAHRDIFEIKQLRLVMCTLSEGKAMGLIDLYDFEPQHARAGLGIVISDQYSRGKGFAKEAIELVKEYAFEHLALHQLYASIMADNETSLRLFEKAGFQKTGERRDWVKHKGNFKDELFYQCIHE